MHMIQKQHLLEINQLLTMYRTLSLPQLYRFFPDLLENTILTLVKKLQKLGRIAYDAGTGIITLSNNREPDNEIMPAIWVLLDFLPSVTYHTIGSFPTALTFYTENEGYDVIIIPLEKEILMNHTLPAQQEGNKRLVIITNISQLQKIKFPQIAAFCLISEDGQVQYFKKQGGT